MTATGQAYYLKYNSSFQDWIKTNHQEYACEDAIPSFIYRCSSGWSIPFEMPCEKYNKWSIDTLRRAVCIVIKQGANRMQIPVVLNSKIKQQKWTNIAMYHGNNWQKLFHHWWSCNSCWAVAVVWIYVGEDLHIVAHVKIRAWYM